MEIKKHLIKVPVIRHFILAFDKPNPQTKHLTARTQKPIINYANHGHE